MALVMRLKQMGNKNRRVYRCVVADSRSPRDGKYVDSVGSYDPLKEDPTTIHSDKVRTWMEKGVRPTEKVKSILKSACPDVLAEFTTKVAKKSAKKVAKKESK